MIVKGVQRPQMKRRSGAELYLFAAFFLAVSTQTISHQDALSRFGAGVEIADRWRVHTVAKTIVGTDGTERRFAALIGPGLVDATAVPIDPAITGSIADTPPGSINRYPKADALVDHRPVAYRAGAFASSGLFDPVDEIPTDVVTAFAAPAADRETEVAAAADAQAESEAKPDGAITVAYAPGDDQDGAPFDAVMGKSGKGAVILDPDIGANHAWLNYAIPDVARSKKETACLANAIYFEARGEPERGRIAVAQVVINRLKNPAYPNTLCSVVYQNKHKRNRCQFSFACDGIRDRVTDKKSWAEAESLAESILHDDKNLFQADIGAATHYHATYVRPRWARSTKKKQRIGRHIFYQTYGGGWS